MSELPIPSQPNTHQLDLEMANAWRDYVIDHPDLIDLVPPAEKSTHSNAAALIDKRRASRASSLLRYGLLSPKLDEIEDVSVPAAKRMLDAANPIDEWRDTSEEYKSYAVVKGERAELFRAELPKTIMGIEKDRQQTQDEIFKLLWKSGQKGGLNETELLILKGWRERKADLGGTLLEDMYNRLRVPFNDLPEEQAKEKFWQAVERTKARVRLEKRAQADQDGIYHMPSTDHLIERMMPQVGAGRHVLMMGMPGIAKSRVALYMAKKVNNYNGREDMPLFETSIKPDTPVGDVIGRWVLRNGESVFEEGPVLKALSADSVVSVEEFNNADHDVQSMLQRIMLLKVGEPFVVQQGDAKKEYVRGKNFCIIASANPDTKATNRFKLDNAMRERFTGGIFESLYPDSKVKLGEDLEEIPDFVDSLLVDKATLKRKLPNKHWSDEDVDKLGRVAYWTQVLATNPGSTLKIDERNPSSKYIEGMLDQKAFSSERYPLSEIILSPRQLEQCIRRAQSDPDLSLMDTLVQFANAPDFRTLKTEQKTFANMLVQLMITDQETANHLFRLSP